MRLRIVIMLSFAWAVLSAPLSIVWAQADIDEQELATWEQPLTMTFDGVDWHQAVRMTADQLERPVNIAPEILESDERSPNLLLHANFVKSPAGVVLHAILSSQDLHWRLEEGRVVIAEGFDERYLKRRYKLDRFVARGWILRVEPENKVEVEGDPNTDFFGVAPPAYCHRQPTLAELIYEITELVDWEDVNGFGGSIEVDGTSLSIVHTLNTHGRIRRMLSLLDEMTAGKYAKDGVRCFQEPGDAIVHDALSKPVTVQCKNVSLPEALQLLEAKSGVPVRTYESDFELESSLTTMPKGPVSLTVNNVSLARALYELCKPLDLTYVVYLGQCRIVEPAIYNPIEIPWLYDITDFAANVGEQMVEILYEKTSVDWVCQSGIAGRAAHLPGDILFVRHTDSAQHEVQHLLQELRHSQQ